MPAGDHIALYFICSKRDDPHQRMAVPLFEAAAHRAKLNRLARAPTRRDDMLRALGHAEAEIAEQQRWILYQELFGILRDLPGKRFATAACFSRSSKKRTSVW
jgi:hypothetical protein